MTRRSGLSGRMWRNCSLNLMMSDHC
jgi:hypothetical protein